MLLLLMLFTLGIILVWFSGIHAGGDKQASHQSIWTEIAYGLSQYPLLRNKTIDILRSYTTWEHVALNTTVILEDSPAEACFKPRLSVNVSLEISTSEDEAVNIILLSPSGSVIGSWKNVESLEYVFNIDSSGNYCIVISREYKHMHRTKVRVIVKFEGLIRDASDSVYKIFAIGSWISNNILYVNDPLGLDHASPPLETLRLGAGDCEDIAVLIAAMARSVGLESIVSLVDLDDDRDPEHAAALIYIDMDPEEVAEKLKVYNEMVRGEKLIGLTYFTGLGEDRGVWIIIDPAMAPIKTQPWYVDAQSYKLIGYMK